MNPALTLKKISVFLRKRKENLLTGGFLLISAVISLEPGFIHLVDGVHSIGFSLLTLSDYVSIIIFSLIMMLPSLILFSITYLLWEGHSLGWKLSIPTCGIALLIAIASSSTFYFTLPIALLSGLASSLEILKRRRIGNRTKDSPIATENIVKLGLRFAAAICASIVMAMVAFVIAMATPFLSLQLFTSMNLNIANVNRICWGVKPIGSVGGVMGYAIGSLLLVTFCEFVAVPIGVCAAIYLAEYSSQNRIVSTIRFFIETLAGSPSVVIAIIGFAIFTVTLGWDDCLWGAAIALSFMALPWNIRVAEESLKSVPRSYREASFALGATQWQTTRLVTLYAALPGIITGILLGIGVALGETLILLSTYTASNTFYLPSPWWRIFDLRQEFPSLTVFIKETPGSVTWMGNVAGGNSHNVVFYSWCLAFAAATVLIIIYLVLCIGALLLRNYLNKRMKGA